MKNIVFLMTLIFGITISQFSMISKVEAVDVYVGTSDVTGRDCYVVTESIYWLNPYVSDATLKMVNAYGDVQRLQYRFTVMKRWVEFENSQGFSGIINDEVPIEKAMWLFVVSYSERNKMRY